MNFNRRIFIIILAVTTLNILFFGVLNLHTQSYTRDILGSTTSEYYLPSSFVKPADVITPTVAGIATPTPYPTKRLPILMYHYVEHVKDRGDKIRISLSITPEEFEHQIKSILEAGYTTHFVREVPAIIKGEIPYDPKMVFITFDDGYEDFYTDVFPILKRYNIRSTAYIISDLIGHHNYMKEDQLREVIASGIVEIGSHSLTHPVLKDSSYDFAKREIFKSKMDLSERFKIRVDTFAYPYGSFSGKDAELVKEAGYKAAVSVIPSVHQSEENMFYLYRIRPGEIGFNDTAKGLSSYSK